jgi:hypothetical protein
MRDLNSAGRAAIRDGDLRAGGRPGARRSRYGGAGDTFRNVGCAYPRVGDGCSLQKRGLRLFVDGHNTRTHRRTGQRTGCSEP